MDRKKILIKNISLGFVFKILNMIVVFTTIPLLLSYLEDEQYGVWVTIFSIVNIVFFVDAGIGNGLKTKLAEAISARDHKLSKTYITTAYISIALIALAVFLLGIVLVFTLNLQNLLNTSIDNSELKTVFLIILITAIFSFILSLFKSFYYASQQSSKVELAMLLYQITILILITVLLYFYPRSLLLVSCIYGFSNVLIGIVFTTLFFKKNKKIRPSISFFDKKKMKDLIGLSLGFFAIQLCMIVIFTTDNLIISSLLGPEEVTQYDIVLKLFQFLVTISVILLDPFWALFTDAYNKKDITWIKQTLKKLNKIFFLFIIVVFVLVMFTKNIISVWIGKDFTVVNMLPYFMGIFVLVRVYPVMYMFFLNAIGKIKLQMYLYIFGAIINIPLSIFFVKYLDFGIAGVILGTICSIVSMVFLLPIQTFKILKKNEPSL
jgi:O-antigen/teichoic acid export membrane protein